MRVEIARLEKDDATIGHVTTTTRHLRVLDSEPNAATGARDKPERSPPPPMPVHGDAACSGGMTRVRRSRASHL